MTHVDLPSRQGDVDRPRGVRAMAPADAMWHWFATKFPTDQFLIFAFDGVPVSVPEAVDAALDRARRIPDLTVRIQEDRFGLRFPRWMERDVDSTQAVVHELSTPTWATCLDAVNSLVEHQLDAHVAAWRLHVYASVSGVPGAVGPATVVALQITHALGDGPRTTALAAAMFGRDAVPAIIAPGRAGPLMRSTSAAVRAKRELARDVEAGRYHPRGRRCARSASTPGRRERRCCVRWCVARTS